jgi:hypothetical protein
MQKPKYSYIQEQFESLYFIIYEKLYSLYFSEYKSANIVLWYRNFYHMFQDFKKSLPY